MGPGCAPSPLRSTCAAPSRPWLSRLMRLSVPFVPAPNTNSGVVVKGPAASCPSLALSTLHPPCSLALSTPSVGARFGLRLGGGECDGVYRGG